MCRKNPIQCCCCGTVQLPTVATRSSGCSCRKPNCRLPEVISHSTFRSAITVSASCRSQRELEQLHERREKWTELRKVGCPSSDPPIPRLQTHKHPQRASAQLHNRSGSIGPGSEPHREQLHTRPSRSSLFELRPTPTGKLYNRTIQKLSLLTLMLLLLLLVEIAQCSLSTSGNLH